MKEGIYLGLKVTNLKNTEAFLIGATDPQFILMPLQSFLNIVDAHKNMISQAKVNEVIDKLSKTFETSSNPNSHSLLAIKFLKAHKNQKNALLFVEEFKKELGLE